MFVYLLLAKLPCTVNLSLNTSRLCKRHPCLCFCSLNRLQCASPRSTGQLNETLTKTTKGNKAYKANREKRAASNEHYVRVQTSLPYKGWCLKYSSNLTCNTTFKVFRLHRFFISPHFTTNQKVIVVVIVATYTGWSSGAFVLNVTRVLLASAGGSGWLPLAWSRVAASALGAASSPRKSARSRVATRAARQNDNLKFNRIFIFITKV